MSEIERTINQGISNMNSCVDMIEKGNKHTAIAFFKITKRIIEEYPNKTDYLKAKYERAKALYDAKFGDLEKELQ